MFRGGANGGNIKWIVQRKILCNNVNGQLRTPMHQHETHTVFISGVPSQDRLSSEKPHGMRVALVTCWFNYCFEFEQLNFAKSFAALCSQPPSFLPSILDYPIMHCSLRCTLAARPAMCSFISTDPGPLLCCDSKVRIVCGSAVEALPNHLWSSCIVLLTDLPVVWWTGGECLQGQGELSNAAGCMVSDWRTWSLRASADSINHRLLIFCPDGWGVLCAPLTVHLNV